MSDFIIIFSISMCLSLPICLPMSLFTISFASLNFFCCPTSFKRILFRSALSKTYWWKKYSVFISLTMSLSNPHSWEPSARHISRHQLSLFEHFRVSFPCLVFASSTEVGEFCYQLNCHSFLCDLSFLSGFFKYFLFAFYLLQFQSSFLE